MCLCVMCLFESLKNAGESEGGRVRNCENKIKRRERGRETP